MSNHDLIAHLKSLVCGLSLLLKTLEYTHKHLSWDLEGSTLYSLQFRLSIEKIEGDSMNPSVWKPYFSYH